jgi:hypothetical protein
VPASTGYSVCVNVSGYLPDTQPYCVADIHDAIMCARDEITLTIEQDESMSWDALDTINQIAETLEQDPFGRDARAHLLGFDIPCGKYVICVTKL